jgi:hypothetical protein
MIGKADDEFTEGETDAEDGLWCRATSDVSRPVLLEERMLL